ncbi:MFS transporter [Nonomuraea sp. NPDC050328]|uniref:MFS transporter n=1 Tax=Nonomuraea sp. NPDC050328 TaxID=3364361 RepID=UPI00379B763B
MSLRAGPEHPRFRDTVRRLPPTVWIVSLGILVVRVGNFLPVFMVLYLTSRDIPPAAAGLVLGAAGLGNILGSAIGGYLADRIGRRWTIVLSMVTTAGPTAAIPLFDELAVLISLVFLAGTASQIYRPAAAALLVDATTTTQQRLAAFAVHRFAMNIGAAVGGVLGGILATVSYIALFLGNAVACLLLAAIAALFLRDLTPARAHPDIPGDPPPAPPPGEPIPATPEPSYRQALTDRRLRRFLVMTVIAEFVYIQSTVGLPLHVDAHHLTPADFGLLMGLNGVMVLLLELPITGLVSRRSPGAVLALGNVLTGVGLAMTGFFGEMHWLAATILIWTMGEMLYASMASAYLGDLAPPTMGGRYQGLYSAAITAGTGLGPLIGGAVYAFNSWALWTVCALGGLLSAWLCLPSWKDRRTRTTSAMEEPKAPAPPVHEPGGPIS